MFQPDTKQWQAIGWGFALTFISWGGATYGTKHGLSYELSSLGRFFIPLGTVLWVWYLETKKGKKP